MALKVFVPTQADFFSIKEDHPFRDDKGDCREAYMCMDGAWRSYDEDRDSWKGYMPCPALRDPNIRF